VALAVVGHLDKHHLLLVQVTADKQKLRHRKTSKNGLKQTTIAPFTF